MLYLRLEIVIRRLNVKRRFFRILNARLPETEQRKIERMALKGYAVDEFTTLNIYFTKSEPESVHAKLICHDVVGVGYMELVAKMGQQGWIYATNDGAEYSLFICKDAVCNEPEYDKKASLNIIKRRIGKRSVISIIGCILMIIVFISGSAISKTMTYSRLFFCLALFFMNLQWAIAVWSEWLNLCALRDIKKRRKGNAEYVIHVGLIVLFIVLLIIAFII